MFELYSSFTSKPADLRKINSSPIGLPKPATRSNTANPIPNKRHKIRSILPILMYINMFATLALCISLFLRLWLPLSDKYCVFFRIFGLMSFQTARSSLFLIFIFRLEISYSDQAKFAVNKYHIYILYTLVFLYWFPYMVYYLIAFFGIEADAAQVDPELKICVSLYQSVLIIVAYLIDIILSIDTLYLFLRPLRRHIALLKAIDYSETEKTRRTNRFYRIMIKYGLLVGLCIVSSLMAYPIVITVRGYGTFIGFLDAPINIICVVLLKAEHDKAYNILCGSCNRVCIFCCNDGIRTTDKNETGMDNAKDLNIHCKQKTPNERTIADEKESKV